MEDDNYFQNTALKKVKKSKLISRRLDITKSLRKMIARNGTSSPVIVAD